MISHGQTILYAYLEKCSQSTFQSIAAVPECIFSWVPSSSRTDFIAPLLPEISREELQFLQGLCQVPIFPYSLHGDCRGYVNHNLTPICLVVDMLSWGKVSLAAGLGLGIVGSSWYLFSSRALKRAIQKKMDEVAAFSEGIYYDQKGTDSLGGLDAYELPDPIKNFFKYALKEGAAKIRYLLYISMKSLLV